MRFSVSVPVLSEQITVVLPSASTAGRRRMMARRRAYGYVHYGPWEYARTLDSYFELHQAMLGDPFCYFYIQSELVIASLFASQPISPPISVTMDPTSSP